MAGARKTPYERFPITTGSSTTSGTSLCFDGKRGQTATCAPPADSAPRLAALYDRCLYDGEWCVTPSTAALIASATAHQALCDAKYQIAVDALNRLMTHPRYASLEVAERADKTSLMAAAHLLNGDPGQAARLWLSLEATRGWPQLRILYDLVAACESIERETPAQQVVAELIPVVGLLKQRSRALAAVASGETDVTFAELMVLLEDASPRKRARKSQDG